MKLFKGKKLGYICGFLAILIYSIINILGQKKPISSQNKFVYALIFVFVKEFFSILSSILISKNPFKKIKEYFVLIKKDKKGFIGSSIAGILGGTMGFTLTIVGGSYMGSGLASPIYALEIFIVMLVVYFLFKKKTIKLHVFGILLTSISALLMPLISLILEGGKIESIDKAFLGILLMVLGVSCWSIESIIFDRLTMPLESDDKKLSIKSNTNKFKIKKLKNNSMYKRKVETLVSSKQIASFFMGFGIMLPIFGEAFTSVEDAYRDFNSIFYQNSSLLLHGFFAGILLYLGRLCIFNAIKKIGATTANSIYSLLPLAQTPLAYIAREINSQYNPGNINHAAFWPLMFLMVVGIFISYYAQIKKDGKRI